MPKTSNSSPIFFILFIDVFPSIFVCRAQDKEFLPTSFTRPARFYARYQQVYRTLVVPKAQASKFALLCPPLHLAGVEIVVAFDYPNLRGEFAELSLLPSLRRPLGVIFTNSLGGCVALLSFSC